MHRFLLPAKPHIAARNDNQNDNRDIHLTEVTS